MVSIHAKKLIDCVSAMSVLISTISEELNAPVAVDLLTHENSEGKSLHLILERQAQRERNLGTVKYMITIILSAGAGAFLQWLLLGGL